MDEIPILVETITCEVPPECTPTETISELEAEDAPVDELSILAADATMPIAIVGMGFRGPGDARNVRELWEMIMDRREGWKPIPKSRWNNEAFYHPDNARHGTINVQGGNFIEEDISLFDAPFFNMTGDEAAAMDPQQRLLLEVTYETLENGGFTIPQIMGSKTSCFVGSFCADYTDLLLRDSESVPMYQCTNAGQSRAMTANRISYFFDLKGPSVTVDTACSGSLVALHLACQSLQTGDASMAIAAGVNLILSHEFMSTMSMMKFLSPDGRCYTFDERANGYARGEAVGCLMLKPLADALRDQDTIRAIIRGSGSNQDGRTPGITLPSGTAQEILIRDVYSRAGLCPSETEVIEAHGTGTQAGDPVETGAISRVFCTTRPLDQPLRIGSIKTNVGHLEGASGIAGVIKAALMLENRIILPTRNFVSPNPRIPLNEWKMKVQVLPEAWETPGPHRVSVNSFGYGGSNAHVILEDFSDYLRSRGLESWHQSLSNAFHMELLRSNGHCSTTSSKPRLFVVSGFDETSCAEQIKSLIEYLLTKRDITDDYFMADLAYTLNERRSRFMWKAAVAGSSATDVISSLSRPINIRSSTRTPVLGFIFTGQGAQWTGMGKELFHFYSAFQESISKVDQILLNLGASFRIYDEICRIHDSQLSNPIISQTVCSALQIALVDLLASWAIYPDSVTGHSSGEIAAAYASGALSMKDAIMVAYFRGVAANKLLTAQEARGAMMAIGAPAEDIKSLLTSISSGKLTIACINSPSSVTVSGDVEAIQDLAQYLKDRSIFHRRLAVDVAYHSHHMDLVAGDYLQSLKSIHPRGGRPFMTSDGQFIEPMFFSSVTGTELQADELGPQYWVANLLGQVKFAESLRALCFGTSSQRHGVSHPARRHTKRTGIAQKASVNCLLEVGPHSALSGPVKQIIQSDAKLKTAEIIYDSMISRNSDAVNSALRAVSTLASLNYPLDTGAINFYRDVNKGRPPQLLVDMPPYSWNHTRSYWAEPRVSRAFRTRERPRTEILGAMDSVSCPSQPRWRNHLRISEVPWLADHRIQSDIVFPAAGYLSMAIEAAIQLTKDPIQNAGVILQNISIHSALIVPESGAIEVMTSLLPIEGANSGCECMYKFHIYSVSKDDRWTQHCTGIVGIEKMPGDDDIADYKLTESNLTLSEENAQDIAIVNVRQLYERLHRMGLEYGKTFANMTSAHVVKDGACFAEVTIPDTEAVMPMGFENSLIIHPCTLDSLFHTIFAALPRTIGLEKGPMIPVFLEAMRVSIQIVSSKGHILGARTVVRPGPQGNIIASIVAAGVSEDRTSTRIPEIAIKGLRCARLEAMPGQLDNRKDIPIAYCIEWRRDPRFSLHDNGDSHLQSQPNGSGIPDSNKHYDYRLACLLKNLLPMFHDQRENLDPIRRKYLSELVDIMNMHSASYEIHDRSCGLASEQTGEPIAKLFEILGHCLSSISEDRMQDFTQLRTELWSAYWNVVSSDNGIYRAAADYLDMIGHKTPDFSILELSDGVAPPCPILLEHLLKDLVSGDKQFPNFREYVFASQSDSELDQARARLAPWSEWVSHATFSIEKPLPEQGVQEHAYDIIFIPHGLRSFKSIVLGISNLHSLLKPSGCLMVIDSLSSRRNMLNSVLEKVLYAWPFTELGGAAGSDIDGHDSEKMLRDSDFSTGYLRDESGAQQALEPDTCIIAQPQCRADPDKNILIISEECHDKDLINCLQCLLQESSNRVSVSCLANAQAKDKVCVFFSDMQRRLLTEPSDTAMEKIKEIILQSAGVLWITRGGALCSTNPESALAVGFTRTARSESGVNPIITLDLDEENSLSQRDAVEIIYKVIKSRLLSKDSGDEDTEYVERNGQLLIPRVKEGMTINRDLGQIEKSEVETTQYFRQRDQPICLTRASINDTRACFTTESRLNELPEGHVGIEVLAFTLSYSDVNGTSYDDSVDTPIGFECSGRVYAVGPGVDDISVGDRVACFGNSTCRSFYHDMASSFQKIDNSMSYELAATLPLAYSVAYCITTSMANLAPSDTVLIDDAAGWCQQAILEVLGLKNVRMFAVVSTPSQKESLVDELGIPHHDIFIAGETKLVKTIDEATNGKGASLVLTSTAVGSSDFRALSKCVASFGKFIQLRGFEAETAQPCSIAWRRNNISFCPFNIFQLPRERPDMAHFLWSQVMRLFREGRLRGPFKFSKYKITELTEALQALPLERHVVLTAIANEPVQVTRPNLSVGLFHQNASYLLVGGLGGIGRAVALWMADRGAQHLILVNRSGLSTEIARSAVQELRAKCSQVLVYACDIANEAQVNDMIKDITQKAPPIIGVIHGAMVLKDTHIAKMSADEYNAVLRPRHTGTWNLHRHLPANMDFFVMLSSISGVIGNATQAAYAAGSAFMDSFAAYRNALGLPAVSLDLGTITDVGYLAENKQLAAKMEKQGFQGTDTLRLLSLIQLAITQPQTVERSQITTGLGEWRAGESLANFDAPLFSHFRRRFRGQEQLGQIGDTVDVLRDNLRDAKTQDEAILFVLEALSERLAEQLGVSVERIEPASPLSDFGVDSHVAVELRNWISKSMESTIPILEILASDSVLHLAEHIASRSQLLTC